MLRLRSRKSVVGCASRPQGCFEARLLRQILARLPSESRTIGLAAAETDCVAATIISITDSVLTRAGRPFPVEPIRTRDAIHLATADLLGEVPQLVTVLTRDTRVREHAQALGYVVA
jgi:hypothetical protein